MGGLDIPSPAPHVIAWASEGILHLFDNCTLGSCDDTTRRNAGLAQYYQLCTWCNHTAVSQHYEPYALAEVSLTVAALRLATMYYEQNSNWAALGRARRRLLRTRVYVTELDSDELWNPFLDHLESMLCAYSLPAASGHLVVARSDLSADTLGEDDLMASREVDSLIVKYWATVVPALDRSLSTYWLMVVPSAEVPSIEYWGPNSGIRDVCELLPTDDATTLLAELARVWEQIDNPYGKSLNNVLDVVRYNLS